MTEEPISAGRQLGGLFGVRSGASREEAPEEEIFLSRDAAPEVLRDWDEQSGTQEWLTQEGPRNIGWFSPRICPKDRAPRRGRTGERPANLRAAQSSRRSGSSHEGVVRWEATPELVSQDRERVGAFGFLTSCEHRQILRSAQWGLAAMPAPISFGQSRCCGGAPWRSSADWTRLLRRRRVIIDALTNRILAKTAIYRAESRSRRLTGARSRALARSRKPHETKCTVARWGGSGWRRQSGRRSGGRDGVSKLIRSLAALALLSLDRVNRHRRTANVSALSSTAPWWERVTVTVSRRRQTRKAADIETSLRPRRRPAMRRGRERQALRPSVERRRQGPGIPASPSSGGSTPAACRSDAGAAGRRHCCSARQVMSLAIDAKGRSRAARSSPTSGDMTARNTAARKRGRAVRRRARRPKARRCARAT